MFTPFEFAGDVLIIKRFGLNKIDERVRFPGVNVQGPSSTVNLQGGNGVSTTKYES